jgi:cell division septum initiation protein DivIVA
MSPRRAILVIPHHRRATTEVSRLLRGGTTLLRIARTHEPEGAAAVPFIAPSEIQSTRLGHALRGYDREETDTLLGQIKASYERVWEEREELRAEVMRLQAQARENGQLRAELERIEPELEELRKVESLLRGALVSAERTTAKLKDEARSEAETTVERARKHADELNTKAENDRDRLEQELEELEETTRQVRERCREFLVQALEAIERSDSLTALGSEQQELPAPLGHLNDA